MSNVFAFLSVNLTILSLQYKHNIHKIARKFKVYLYELKKERRRKESLGQCFVSCFEAGTNTFYTSYNVDVCILSKYLVNYLINGCLS